MRTSRRRFFETTGALSALGYRRVLGANERIGLGFIGYGLIGKRHVADFRRLPDAEGLAVCDVYKPRVEEGKQAIGAGAEGYRDFRKLLENRRVDAVVISTPDHWHALMTMLALDAGKDVYVEKPLTLFQREGLWIQAVAERTKRVVQVGVQQRSGLHYQRARTLIHRGDLGRIVTVRMGAYRNLSQGFGRPADSNPPADFDWDLWQGPAPTRPYNPLRALYHFRWFWDYSGGQMTNLAAHHLDIVDWTLGLGKLRTVSCVGGRFAQNDLGETPDTQDAIFHAGDYTIQWSLREMSKGSATSDFSLEFFGTKGALGISRSGFKITPDPDLPASAFIPSVGDHPIGGPTGTPAKGRDAPPKTTPLHDKSGSSDEQYHRHARNFLDCIRSRKTPISDLASGHRTATACHLANLSMRLERTLRWSDRDQQVAGDAEANQGLTRPYRSPWDREREALGVG